MKSIFKQIILWSSTLVLTTGIAFASFFDYSSLNKNQGNNGGNGNNNGGGQVENPLSPSQKLLNSLISLDEATIDGGIEVTFDNNTVDVNVDGKLGLDTANIANTRFEGNVDVQFNGIDFHGAMNYYDGKIFFDYEDSKLYLETDSLLNFVNMIPNYGVDVALPEELTNLDINKIMTDLGSMEPEKVPGGYFFKLSLSDQIDLLFKSDENYNFIGVKTNKFYFKDTYIYLDFDVNQDLEESLTFTEPNILLYQDFAPTFDLINVLHNTFTKANNTLNLNVAISNLDNPYLTFDGDISYDTSLSRLSFDGKVIEENYDRTHSFKLGMQDNNLLVNYNALKFKVENQSILALLDYVLNKVGDSYLTDALGGMSDILQDTDILGILDNLSTINNIITNIEVKDDSFVATLNLSALGIEAADIKIALNFDTKTFKGISISGLDINGYKADINLTTKEYNPISFDMAEYVSVDPALCLVDSIYNLAQEKRFRLDFTGTVDDTSVNNQDLSVNGGLQFDIENKFGYGDMNLVDPSTYNHNIRVDMRSFDEILFTYNEATKGRFSSNFFTDVIDMVSEILNNKDDHFYELFGDLMGSMASLPIMDAINDKDYGRLFEIGLIDSFNVTSNTIELGLKGGLIGIDSTLKVIIGYDTNVSSAAEALKYLEIKDFKYGESVYSFKVNLNKFDDSLEENRLDPFDTYIDFDSLAVLLRLGINTSIYNHYHFSGSASVNLTLFGLGLINIDIPIDVKILNEKGNVSLAIEFSDIPIILGVNGGLTDSDRKASIYMKDGMFYIYRTNNFKRYVFPSLRDYKYETYVKADADNFLDNIVVYLCKTVLGFNDSIMNEIVGDGSSDDSSSTDSTIHYENLLSDYSYNSVSETPYFNVGINMFELTKMDMFDDLNLKVYVNDETKTLSGIDVNINLDVFVTIALGARLDLVNLGEKFTLDAMNSYINSHSGDTLNEIIEKETKI